MTDRDQIRQIVDRAYASLNDPKLVADFKRAMNNSGVDDDPAVIEVVHRLARSAAPSPSSSKARPSMAMALYVIWWPAAGGQVLHDGPVAEFPPWVLELLNAPRGGPCSLSLPSSSGDDRREGASPSFAGRGDGSTLSVLPRSREASHAHVALKAAMDELLNARRGERNRKLNARAYNLGRLVARGWITVPKVVNGLELACQYNLLTQDKGPERVRATIKSGLKAGMQRPYPDIVREGA